MHRHIQSEHGTSSPSNRAQFGTLTLVVLSLANALNFYNRTVLFVLAEPIRQAFSLTDTQVGALSSAFELLYPIAAFLLAIVADRWARKGVIALGMTVWSLCAILSGVASSYVALLLSRIGVGLGIGSYAPAALAILSDTYPRTHRTRATSIHDCGIIVGTTLGFVLGGLIGQAMGWHISILIAGLMGLPAIILVMSLREPKRGFSEYSAECSSVDGKADQEVRIRISRAMFPQLFTVPTLWAVYVGGILVLFATGAVMSWLSTFMIRMHGYGVGKAGIVTGAIQTVSGALGILVGGWVADRWLARDRGGRLLTMGTSLLIGTPFAIAAILVSDTVSFIVLASIASFCYVVFVPCMAPQIHDVTRPSLRATAFGLYLLLTHLLGDLPAPTFVGWLSDQAGSLRFALLIAPGMGLLAGVIFLFGASYARRDSKALATGLRREQA